MTIEAVLLILGIGESVVRAISALIDIHAEVTPETMVDLKAAMSQAEQRWADA